MTKKYIPQGYEWWQKRPADDPHRDWKYDTENWLSDYMASVQHPHREAIVKVLEDMEPYESLLEIGCNVGANLAKTIGKRLSGIDANAHAIGYARSMLGTADLRVGDFQKLPWEDKSHDIVLADAVLMYIDPEHIDATIAEIDRVARFGIVLVERYHRLLKGGIRGYVWGRNYKIILEKKGYTVQTWRITKNLWPESENWQKYGIVLSAVRSQIGEIRS